MGVGFVIKEIVESKEKALKSIEEKSWSSFLSYVGRIHVINKEGVEIFLGVGDSKSLKEVLRVTGSSLIEIEKKLTEVFTTCA